MKKIIDYRMDLERKYNTILSRLVWSYDSAKAHNDTQVGMGVLAVTTPYETELPIYEFSLEDITESDIEGVLVKLRGSGLIRSFT